MNKIAKINDLLCEAKQYRDEIRADLEDVKEEFRTTGADMSPERKKVLDAFTTTLYHDMCDIEEQIAELEAENVA